MSEAVLVTTYPGWTTTERAAYSGVPVRLLQATDWKGNQLVLLLGGPLCGEMRWMREAEIIRTEEEQE